MFLRLIEVAQRAAELAARRVGVCREAMAVRSEIALHIGAEELGREPVNRFRAVPHEEFPWTRPPMQRARTLQALPAAGEPATLSIETYVREDQIRLFGFLSDAEREWFRLLQTVQGVGARVALAVLSTLSPPDLANAIALRDMAMVSRAPGVGKKVAERIATELKKWGPVVKEANISM